MDTKKLEVLTCAIDSGSLTAAATRLNYTQSGITQMMAALERDMGFPLLIRSRNGVLPTEECRLLLPTVRTLLNCSERLRQEAAALKGVCSGTVRVCSNNSISMYWMPSIIARFEATYPGVRLELFGGDSAHLTTLLKEGKVDVCLIAGQPENCHWIHLAYDPLYVVLPPGHPGANTDAYPINRLHGVPFLHYSTLRGESMREFDVLLAKTGIQPNVKLVSNNDYAIVSMVERGIGVSIMPELILNGFPQNVLRIPLDPPCSRDLGIALRSIDEASPVVRRFIACAEETILGGAVYLPGKRLSPSH